MCILLMAHLRSLFIVNSFQVFYLHAGANMWGRKKVIYDNLGYASMVLGKKVYECRHGPDHCVKCKEEYRNKREVSFLLIFKVFSIFLSFMRRG